MRARTACALALLFLLGSAIAIYSARIASFSTSARVELGRVKLSEVDDATRERLQALPELVLATYFVSPRAEMPSELRRLERQVTDLLEAFRVAADGKFDYQILDPHSAVDPNEPPTDGQAQSNEQARYAARQGIAPFRVRSVKRDTWSEKTIWSSLSIGYGAYPPAVINGLTEDGLPRLSATILAHLDQMEAPRQPVVALSAPAGFDRLEKELATVARVTRFQFEPGASIPAESDLLFWIKPKSVDREVLRELDRYLKSGRSVVFAGSLQDVRSGTTSTTGQFRPEVFEARPSEFDATTLLGHFGLRALPGLVGDERSMAFVIGEGEDAKRLSIPYLIRCIAPNQRFGLVLQGQPNGTLLFEAPTPFHVSPEELSDRGWSSEVLAHTSDVTWVHPLPTGISDATEFGIAGGTALSRQALITLLKPHDPLRGSVVALASASPLRDDLIHADGFAHRALVDVLVTNLASDNRLVQSRTALALTEPLPELSSNERLFWRALTVGLLPALLCLIAVVRGSFQSREKRASGRGSFSTRTALFALATLVAGAVAIRFTDALPLRADWTEDGLNRLAPATEELARKAGQTGTLRAELFLSRREKLAPDMRRSAGQLDDLFRDLERAGADIELVRTDPSELEPAEREKLERSGIESMRVTSIEEGVTTVRTIFSAVRLTSTVDGEQRIETLALPDTHAFEGLEFRVAFALWRLQTGQRPRLAFASDTPRLSPAEAHMDYQLKGLFAPIGEDTYGTARETLREIGFDILHINPRAPEFTEKFDALVWLQPRRDASVMIDALARNLHQGGSAFLAAQHFNLQARQYRGTNFETVYWPQPQSPDLDVMWFPELGIELARVVLFDELMTPRQLETQVNRDAAQRDYEEQDSALPFSIRASTANFSDDPVMRGVGDQAFLWGNHIEWDAARLEELGLEATTLITSSERTWAYDWSGGYLPQDVLAGFPSEDRENLQRLPRRTLAARFRGNFPLPDKELVPAIEGQPRSDLGLAAAPAAEGELLLVGDSEMFKNELIRDPEFRADHLLVNAVASLTLPADLAAVAHRRRVARGLDFLSGESKARWRLFVIAAGPLFVLLLGLLRSLWRRGSS